MSLTKVSFSMINGDYANVVDYGADITGVADSTSAIQAALNSQQPIYFPKGSYKVTAEITLPGYSYGKIIGNGSSIITTATSGSVFASTPNNYDGWRIEDLYIDGNSNQVNGIHLEGFKRTIVENVRFYNCNKGVSLYNDAYYTELRNNKYRNCSYGVYIDGASAVDGVWPNSSVIVGGSFELCTIGVSIQKCSNLRIFHSAIEQSATNGIILASNAVDNVIVGNRFESDSGYHLAFSSGETQNVFVGNMYIGSAGIKSGVTPSNRDTFIEGYEFYGVAKGFYERSTGKWAYGESSSYVETQGIGLTEAAPLEFMLDGGTAATSDGFKLEMNPSTGYFELYYRDNSTSWYKCMTIRQNASGHARLGDAGDPTAATLSSLTLGVDELVSEPAKSVGTIAFADGTYWNPGSGRGFYGWDGSAWSKLG